MKFFNRVVFPSIMGLLFITSIVSCNEDVTTVGGGVIGGEPFATDVASFDVFAFNRRIQAVQTNRLPLYQLGSFNDPIYGRTEARITSQLRYPLTGGQTTAPIANPTFGNLSQDAEASGDDGTIAENETVTSVFLYIPYQTNTIDRDNDGLDDAFDDDPTDPNSDTDNDGVSDAQERAQGTNPLNEDTDGDGINDGEDDNTLSIPFANRINLDSIFGRRDIPFTLRVERSSFFLSDLDPNTNFEESQEFFSTQDFSSFVEGPVLFEGPITIDDQEIIITTEEDDPDTDEDETETVVLPPGIRVPLNIEVFQDIINREGNVELLTDANFTEFFRGLHLSIPQSNEDILLLLDLTGVGTLNGDSPMPNVIINYEFNSINNNGTVGDTTDDTIEPDQDSFSFNLLQGTTVNNNLVTVINPVNGNAVNTFINDDYPEEIASNLDTEENASRIFLKGGAGSFAEINLFERDNAENIIDEIRANNLIINEANLVFYIDQEAFGTDSEAIEPPRLYLFNADTNTVLFDIRFDPFDPMSSLGSFLQYDGLLEEQDDRGLRYTVRITSLINDIINRNVPNPTLGLTLTSDIRIVNSSSAMLVDGQSEIPIMSTINPFGTVLIGSNVAPEDEDRRLQLNIFFTQSQ